MDEKLKKIVGDSPPPWPDYRPLISDADYVTYFKDTRCFTHEMLTFALMRRIEELTRNLKDK